MAWEEVPQRARAAGEGVRCSLKAVQGGHVRLFVTPAPAVLKALGWMAGDHIGLAKGTGPDRGSVRLTVRSGGGATLRRLGKSKQGLVVALDPGEPLNNITVEGVTCPHHAQDGALVLNLPDDWWEAATNAAAQQASLGQAA